KMINSILQQRSDPVIIHNITTTDDVITNPCRIREEVRSHYETWTKQNPPNWQHWNNWEEDFKPIKQVSENWYEDTVHPISINELTTTIQESPTNKATGPQGISNEMLKHLSTYSTQVLLEIFNACMRLKQIPKMWKHASIFPISKKPKFTGKLMHTRPI